MTPNFALSLSFDGIRLLHRVTGGWHVVGEVALDSPDLGGQLKMLRKTALDLDPAGLRTKILIPNEQIKYTAIDSTQTTLDDVHAALDGLTPYSIHDLVIDFDRSGGRTHIAAVARETLDEAEAFAVDHSFAPVCFAAVSPPFTFSGEVFFGATKAASQILVNESPVERDTAAVQVIGTIDLQDPAPVADTKPIVTEAPLEESVVPKADSGEVDAPTDAPVEEAGDAPVFASRNRSSDKVSDDPAPDAPSVDAAPVPAPEIEPLFTRRKEPPLVAPVTARAEPPVVSTPVAPVLPAEDTVAAPVTAPAATTPDVPEASTFSSIRATAGQDSFAPAVTPTPAPVVVPAPPPPLQPEPARAQPTPQKPDTSKSDNMTVFGARKTEKVGGKPKYLGLMLTAALLLFMLLAALWANTLTEDGIAGWFSRDPQLIDTADVPTPIIQQADEETTQVAATPAPPVLRQPVGRVLSADEADRIYAATGVYQRAPRFPTIPRETSLEGFETANPITPLTPPAAVAMPDLYAMAPDVPLTTPANPPAPGVEYARDLRGFILATPEGTLTPDGVIVIAGAPERVPPLRPGTEVVAPAVVVTPTVDIPVEEEGLILIAGRPPIVPPLRPDSIGPDDEAAAEPPVAPETIVELPEAPATETDVVVAETDAPSLALETETAAVPETVIAAENVVVVSGRPDLVPPLRPDTPILQGATAPLAGNAETETETETERPAEDVIIVVGRPDLVPPLRPAAFASLAPAAPADEAAPTGAVVVNPADAVTDSGVALATFRPSQRPADLAPPAVEEDTVAVATADPTLAGFRPALRPADLAPVQEEEPVIAETTEPEPTTPDINSVIAAIAEAAPPSPIVNATAQAIVVSPRPGPRPGNFGQVVARAQAAAQPRQAAPAPAAVASAPTTRVSSAAVQPTGPVPGGVARAATVNNAIRLRDINLMGVFGRPNDRRALVRLGNGRYVKVEVGSTLDGGQVTAIGESALNYVKRGRTIALELPSG